MMSLLVLTACRAGRPAPGTLVLPKPQTTAFKHVLLLTQNAGEMLVNYDSYQDRVAMLQEPEMRKGRTEEEFKEQLGRVPAGGILFMDWTRPTATLAEPSNFTVVIYSPWGRERERFVPDTPQPTANVGVPDAQGRMSYHQWSVKYLSQPIRNNSRVEIIDRTTGQHFWFLLKLP